MQRSVTYPMTSPSGELIAEYRYTAVRQTRAGNFQGWRVKIERRDVNRLPGIDFRKRYTKGPWLLREAPRFRAYLTASEAIESVRLRDGLPVHSS